MNAPIEQLSCQELVELVTDYAENALSVEDRTRFEEHLGICEGCRNYVDQMRATVARLDGSARMTSARRLSRRCSPPSAAGSVPSNTGR